MHLTVFVRLKVTVYLRKELGVPTVSKNGEEGEKQFVRKDLTIIESCVQC